MLTKTIFKGMETFLVIWGGQLVSLLGSAMTRFALMIWAYDQTHQATTLALLAFFAQVSALLASPLAGVVVDRVNRRNVMIAADLSSGLVTIGLLALYASGGLQIWHLFVAEAISGLCETFQITAYITATSLIVPREQFARAAGLRSMARSVGRVIAPFAAGMLLPFIHIDGIMLIDVASFLAGVGTLLAIRVPQAPPSEYAGQARGGLLHEVRFGFRFIWARPGLVGLLVFFGLVNLFSALTYYGTLPAMILARRGGGELALGSVMSVMGAGALLGSILASTWGGPRRKIHAVLGGAALSFLLGDLVFAFGQSLAVWLAAGFFAEAFIPLIIAGNHAIWQSKVPTDVQGRVFAAQSLLGDLPGPPGYLIAGPLADRLMEPAMQPGGALAGIFGPLVGVGPGAGIAATFIFTGALGVLASLGSYLMKPVRRIEVDLPDVQSAPEGEADGLAPAQATP